MRSTGKDVWPFEWMLPVLFWTMVIAHLTLPIYSCQCRCKMTARCVLDLAYVLIIWVRFPSWNSSQLCAQGFTCLGSVQPPVSVWMESMSPQQHVNISQSRCSSVSEESKMCAHLDNKRVWQNTALIPQYKQRRTLPQEICSSLYLWFILVYL